MIRQLTDQERRICQLNCAILDKIFTFCTKKCSAPDCGYPLSGIKENFYSSSLNGPVCEVCHTMETALYTPLRTFKLAHDEWMKDQNRKKQIIENKDI
jgi:hypothetical protein